MRLIRDRSIILGSVLLLAACREAKVESYRVPKEASPPAPLDMPSTQSGPDMASTPVPTASGAELVWTTPDHWVAQPGAPMRKAGYKITAADGGTAELTVTAFPGDVGGDLANVNRWRDQSEVPATSPISDALSKDMKKRGFRFVGSTILYAHLQATGLINDHLLGCFRHTQCR